MYFCLVFIGSRRLAVLLLKHRHKMGSSLLSTWYKAVIFISFCKINKLNGYDSYSKNCIMFSNKYCIFFKWGPHSLGGPFST